TPHPRRSKDPMQPTGPSEHPATRRHFLGTAGNAATALALASTSVITPTPAESATPTPASDPGLKAEALALIDAHHEAARAFYHAIGTRYVDGRKPNPDERVDYYQ